MRKFSKSLVLALLLATISGCSNFQFPGAYKLIIPQGNITTQEMVDQLKPGMTKRQVRYVLGTSLLQDTFNQDRWDYLLRVQGQDGNIAQKNLVIYFNNGKLSHFVGDFKPSDADSENVASQS